MKIKKRSKKQQIDGGPEFSVKIDDVSWQVATRFVWHSGELEAGKWFDVQEFDLHPERAEFCRSSSPEVAEAQFLSQVRAASQIRGLFAMRSKWDAELIYRDPFEPSRTVKMWTGWWDQGLGLVAVIEVAGTGRMETLALFPAARLRGASAESLKVAFDQMPGLGHDVALKLVLAELDSPVNRSLAFTLPMQPGTKDQPRSLIRDLQLSTIRGLLSATGDRDAFDRTDFLPSEMIPASVKRRALSSRTISPA